MLKFRAISFVLLLGVLAAAVFWRPGGEYLFVVLTLIGGFGVAYEAAKMLQNCAVPTAPCFAGSVLAVCTSMGALHAVVQSPRISLLCQIVFWTAFCLLVPFSLLTTLFARDKKAALLKVITSVGIVVILFVCLFPLILLYGLTNENGIPVLLLYLILTTKAGDTGGYIVGLLSSKMMKEGNHKIVPGISPKKSWEGTIGGLCFSVVVSMVFYWCDCGVFPSVWWYLFSGALLYISGFAGDLTESVFKRVCGVKDSGAIIPGMGGFFDVLDSFIYAAPCFVLIAFFL